MVNPDSLERRVFQALMETQKAIEAKMTAQAVKTGMSLPQIAVFRDIADHPGTGLQEVVERLGIPKSSVSRLVDELVRKEMVVRTIPDENRRSVRLAATESAFCPPVEWNEVFGDRSLFTESRIGPILRALEEIQKAIKG